MSSGDEGFFARVYAFVRRVPRGRVVTYGQVAAMLGVPRGARAVGWALRALPEDVAARVPWHRVVGTGGRISPRRGPGPEIQRRRLRAERVAFRGTCVDLEMHGLLASGITRTGAVPGVPNNRR
jgi:methylated-DNA-protein-cysteine methyltransferase related protein